MHSKYKKWWPICWNYWSIYCFKLFNINIYIYKEGPSNSDNYILYEKIDNDLTIPKCYLFFENENHLTILLQNNTNSIKRIISTTNELKNIINKSTINITKNLL